MSVDVVCASAPFLDITFSGFDRMPALGEERMAEAVEYTPGGIANIALGLTRLGVDAAIWAPVGDDISGRVLNGLLAAEGIDWVGPPGAATAVSVVMPLNGDRGFLSACPEFEIDTDALAALEPRAVVIDLPVVDRAPAGADVHAVVGDVDARRLAGHLPAALADARTLLANEPEAL